MCACPLFPADDARDPADVASAKLYLRNNLTWLVRRFEAGVNGIVRSSLTKEFALSVGLLLVCAALWLWHRVGFTPVPRARRLPRTSRILPSASRCGARSC
jgi:hypothetical protein